MPGCWGGPGPGSHAAALAQAWIKLLLVYGWIGLDPMEGCHLALAGHQSEQSATGKCVQLLDKQAKQMRGT